MAEIIETTYAGWNALELRAGGLSAIIPTEVGPRVLYFGKTGGTNLFANKADEMGGRGEDEWMIRGGHRMWHSPEDPERTYALDNVPFAVERLESGKELVLTPGPETAQGMQKQIVIEADDAGTFTVTNRLRNIGMWPVDVAAWSLTVMAHGGYSTVPLMPKIPHTDLLLPTYHMIPWAYTDFSLPCWDFHHDYIGIDVAKADRPQKLGLSNFPGWVAYWQEAGTFVKRFDVVEGATYPDFGSCYETFCCDWMIEMEALSPLEKLAPGNGIELVEQWTVFDGLDRPDTDAVYTEQLLPKVNAWLG